MNTNTKIEIKNFNREYFKFLFPQRTRLKTEYGLNFNSEQSEIDESLSAMMTKDYNMIKDFLPKNVANILDIGCGIGLIDLALYRHYNNVNLHLLDKTNVIDENTSIRGFNKKYVFYNSMDATKKTLQDNGVDSKNIYIYEVDNNVELIYKQRYDLIVSLLSCGWHYSIETYIDLLKNNLNDDGVLILDIRHDTGQLEYAKEHFELFKHIVNNAESKENGTIGDRYIFRKK